MLMASCRRLSLWPRRWRQDRTGKIAILGNAFGIRDHPGLAEEHAMIDCITGGRLISGMVRGLGAEYYSLGANRRSATSGSTKPTIWS